MADIEPLSATYAQTAAILLVAAVMAIPFWKRGFFELPLVEDQTE